MEPEETRGKNDSDIFLLEDEMSGEHAIQAPKPWKVLISDDEEDVHELTRLVLRKYRFEDRGLEFLSAYSGEETKEVLKKNPDVALVLLDVVMEDFDSGLKVARWIRDELDNRMIRIVLRTGQAGKAPEKEVVSQYDINDYRTKTELTSDRLYTTITSALRSYRDLMRIENYRVALLKIVQATPDLFKTQTPDTLAESVLKHLVEVMKAGGTPQNQLLALAAVRNENDCTLIAATEQCRHGIGLPVKQVTKEDTYKNIEKAAAEQKNILQDNSFTGLYKTNRGTEYVVLLETSSPLTPPEKELITIFSGNIALAFKKLPQSRI